RVVILVVRHCAWEQQRRLVSFSLFDQVYLYQHRLYFTLRDTDGNQIDDFENLELPPGEDKTDDIYGDVKVYFGQLDVPLPLEQVPQGEVELEVHYQGCIDGKLCYPPEIRTFTLNPPSPGTNSSSAPPANPAKAGKITNASDHQDGFLSILFSEDANAFNSWMQHRNLSLIVALFF